MPSYRSYDGYDGDTWEPGYDPGPCEFEDVGDCEVCGDVDVAIKFVRGEAVCMDCDGCDQDDREQFADPGGNSALRAASDNNPRNLPCPNCGEPDRLTPADRARGYQCDTCADQAEHGGY